MKGHPWSLSGHHQCCFLHPKLLLTVFEVLCLHHSFPTGFSTSVLCLHSVTCDFVQILWKPDALAKLAKAGLCVSTYCDSYATELSFT